jgi:hypothetical protein
MKSCFLLGPLKRLYLRIETWLGQFRKGLQADQSEAVVRQSPLVEVWEMEEPPIVASRCIAELVVRQVLANEDMNMETEGSVVWEAVTR